MREILAPAWAGKALQKFGRNPYGKPNFRIVWGPSRNYIAGGYCEDTGKSEYRRFLKYGLDPKWILERWRPASVYGTPQAWEATTVTPEGFWALGPFPAHGEYESIVVFSTEKGIQGYVPLEPGLVELSAQAVWMGRVKSYGDIRRVLQDEALRKEQLQDQNWDEIWKEKQALHEGLTIGSHGFVNKSAEIDDYARRIEKANAFVDARRFRSGFKQN